MLAVLLNYSSATAARRGLWLTLFRPSLYVRPPLGKRTLRPAFPAAYRSAAILAAVGSPSGQPAEVDKVLAYLCPPEPPMAPMF